MNRLHWLSGFQKVVFFLIKESEMIPTIDISFILKKNNKKTAYDNIYILTLTTCRT